MADEATESSLWAKSALRAIRIYFLSSVAGTVVSAFIPSLLTLVEPCAAYMGYEYTWIIGSMSIVFIGLYSTILAFWYLVIPRLPVKQVRRFSTVIIWLFPVMATIFIFNSVYVPIIPSLFDGSGLLCD